VIVAFAIFWGRFETKIEDFAKQQEHLEGDLKESLTALQKTVETRLDAMDKAEQTQNQSFKASITDLKTNVLRLCTGQRRSLPKVCDVNALVAQAKSVSKSQAAFVQVATVELTSGSQPEVASNEIKSQLPAVAWGVTGVPTSFTQKASA